MDYQKIYEEFISDRRKKEEALLASGLYYERHHVKPRCLGGSDESENILALTPGDHLFSHILLGKIYGGRLAVSAMRMCNMKKYEGRMTRVRFAALRARAQAALSEASKGIPKSPEHRKRLAESKTGTTRTKESRARQSASLMGHASAPSVGAALAENNRKREWTTESRAKLGASQRATQPYRPRDSGGHFIKKT